jgi:hypothetical protein
VATGVDNEAPRNIALIHPLHTPSTTHAIYPQGDWKRRFIQFAAGEMRYYTGDPRGGAQRKGSAPLEDASMAIDTSDAAKPPLVLLTTHGTGSSRTFKFRLELRDTDTWEAALAEQLEWIGKKNDQ